MSTLERFCKEQHGTPHIPCWMALFAFAAHILAMCFMCMHLVQVSPKVTKKKTDFFFKLQQISEVHMFRHASSETKWQQTRGGGRIFALVPDKGVLAFII